MCMGPSYIHGLQGFLQQRHEAAEQKQVNLNAVLQIDLPVL